MLPERTVERLSEYRRTLLICLSEGKEYIYSHELAKLHDITAVQVRRDIMLMGFSGILKKGYFIKDLIEKIGQIIDYDEGLNVAIVGFGHLGYALSAYFVGKRSKLNIVAAFDVDNAIINKEYNGVMCYHVSKLPEIIAEKNITIGIITVPSRHAVETFDELVKAGIKGIMNFTSVPLKVSGDVFLENKDMISSLEKIAYFVKKKIQ
jgi:redox-sensing transcriptional repressor